MTENNSEGSGFAAWSLPYGLIFGLILIIQTIVLYLLNLSYEKWAASITYAMMLAMSIYVVYQRKKIQQNYLSLGDGLKAGCITMMIAVLISSVYLFIHINFVDTHFLEAMVEKQIVEMQEKGISGAQLDAAIEWMDKLMTPVMSTAIGFVSSALTCLIFVLISAGFQKNEKAKNSSVGFT